MRVALASVLFAEPDLLLLDEPTNYLDLEGTLWLEDYIRRYPHTVLIISHDRDLLNTAANAIVHLDQKKLTFYRGGFDQFERQKAERDEHQMKAREKSLAARKHMEAFVERFRAKASKARQAQSRLKALENGHGRRGHRNQCPRLLLSRGPIAASRRRSSPSKTARSATRPARRCCHRLDLRIDADDRIALLGSNGNGKSTFAKFIAGRLEAEAGRLRLAPQLKTGFFAQHQMDDLRPNESAVAHVRALMPDAPEARVRARVAQMGLTAEKMNTAAKDLSGGEKARLLMGLATFDAPNLIILDEPTNHLDIDSRAALIRALNDFPGAVILISHDRHLIEATVDRLWIVRDGTVSSFDGDLEDYRQEVVGASGRGKKGGSGDGNSKAEKRKQAAEQRASLAPLKKKISDLEALVARLTKQIDSLDAELANPDQFADAPYKIAQKSKQRAERAAELKTAEEQWLDLTSQVEETEAAE
jgi:ATP-binding cassette subfamily F protein 3